MPYFTITTCKSQSSPVSLEAGKQENFDFNLRLKFFKMKGQNLKCQNETILIIESLCVRVSMCMWFIEES